MLISSILKTSCHEPSWPPTSVTGRKKNIKQLRVLKTLHPWKELEAKAFLTELTIFTPWDENICHGNRKPEASDGQAHCLQCQRDCRYSKIPVPNRLSAVPINIRFVICPLIFAYCMLTGVTHLKPKVRLSSIILWTMRTPHHDVLKVKGPPTTIWVFRNQEPKSTFPVCKLIIAEVSLQ